MFFNTLCCGGSLVTADWLSTQRWPEGVAILRAQEVQRKHKTYILQYHNGGVTILTRLSVVVPNSPNDNGSLLLSLRDSRSVDADKHSTLSNHGPQFGRTHISLAPFIKKHT